MIKQYLKYIPEEEHEAFLDCFSYQTVNTLNECLSLDPQSIETIMGIRTYCNESLGNPLYINEVGANHQLGVMGIINGLLPSNKKVWPVYFKNPVTKSNQLSMFVVKDIIDEENKTDA